MQIRRFIHDGKKFLASALVKSDQVLARGLVVWWWGHIIGYHSSTRASKAMCGSSASFHFILLDGSYISSILLV